jgi:hypothetical protein
MQRLISQYSADAIASQADFGTSPVGESAVRAGLAL